MTNPTLTQRVLDRLTSGPIGQRIIEEDAREQLALRKAKAVQIAALTADFEAALPALVDARAKAQARVGAAQTAVETATAALREAAIVESNLRARFARERDALSAELEATADPEIAAFLGELSVLFEQVRRTPINVSGGTLNLVTEQRSPLTGNGEAVQAQLAAINEARLQAEALKLEALSAGEVAGRLAALRAMIAQAGEAK
ncbi:MAG: hypothetical protein Q7T33_04535 [Dehalococcoidia bacterium]|nr:hypothetical protein [Dehalococcoidia bacterium]